MREDSGLPGCMTSFIEPPSPCPVGSWLWSRPSSYNHFYLWFIIDWFSTHTTVVQSLEDHICVCRWCCPVGLWSVALTRAVGSVKQLQSSTCISTVFVSRTFLFVCVSPPVCVGTSSTRKRKEHLCRWCVGVWMGYAVLMAVILNQWYPINH